MRQENIISSSKSRFSFSRFFINYWGLINLAAVFFLLSLGSFFLLKPQYDKASADIKTDELTGQISQLKRSLAKMSDIESAYAEISDEDKRRIIALAPDEENAEKLFPLIETLVLNSGLLPVSIDVEKEEIQLYKTKSEQQEEESTAADEALSGQAAESLPPEIIKVKISVTVGGAEYPGLKSLLKSLENSLRIMDTQKITFIGSENTTLEILTYYLKP